MKKIISTELKPIKLWLDNIEDGALEQAKNLANLPFIFKHVAIMPDSHEGYGMPIGAIIATKDIIIPNAVGVDIGCGMCAIKTSLKHLEKDTLKKIIGGSKENKGGIRSKIPLGFKHHSKKQDFILMPLTEPVGIICQQEFDSALKQIGTLGGGNHFIEIQKGDDGYIWVMLHSGSRNLGYKVARYYNNIAKELNKKYFSSIPEKYDLAFLPLDSEMGNRYKKEMEYCIEFAYKNRELMINRIKECILNIIPDVIFEEMINIAHNYAIMENHFNNNLLIHRKGATRAYLDQLGIIPGSQGSKSYIIKGLGNKESFKSCSHGAGRLMSRKRAQNELNLNEEIKKLDDLGIIHSIRNKNDLDEATGAYKDISTVINNQLDLIKLEVELTPLAVIKG